MYKIIKNIKEENFLFGGLIYHHKEILDPDKRDKEFARMVRIKNTPYEKLSELKEDFDHLDSVGVENLYQLKAEIESIKNSNSLNEYAMNSVMQYYGNNSKKHPIQDIYEKEFHDNTFIDKGIKIIDSDVIIFISEKGIVGSTYNQGYEQKLAIRYRFDEDLGINIGEVFDSKLIDDFLDYYNCMGDIK